jgi:gliding motility-associated-like protein
VLTQTYSTTFLDVPPGNYFLRVEDRYQQRIQRAVAIDTTIEMAPVIYGTANFGISPFEVEFWFDANTNVRHIEWQYNEQTSQELRPVFRFVGEGEHLVYLTVFSGNPNDPGVCAETVGPFVVLTEQQVVIQVPDVITPNGDGINDYFEVYQKNLQHIEVQILDRRGVLVYAYDDLEGFWDGKYSNGKEAPDAMYYYHIKGIGFDELLHSRSGMFQLIRETIHVFPNPASGLVNIEWPGRITHVAEVGVYDLRGNRVLLMQELSSPGLVQLDISGLEDGVYLVRVSDGINIMNARLHVLKR